ncbi:hypothetical protein QA596_09540 [Balneolales bacterium ANBcel1]|nr:hypothetical protein [Balneolales bacterium ANBcel1]
MKEIRIKVSSIWREVLIWVIMLAVAFLTNVYAIRTYDGQWSELISQLHIVLLLSVVYYVLLAVLRLIIRGVYLLISRLLIPALQKSRG